MVEKRYIVSAIIQNRSKEFVKKPLYLQGISQLLNQFDFPTSLVGNGLLKVSFNSSTYPLAVVSGEQFFQKINPIPEYKINNTDPSDWFTQQLIVVDGEWAAESIVADFVLQAQIFQAKYDPKVTIIDDEHISEKARLAANHFLVQGLDRLYREKWYQWLQLGI